MRLIFLEEVPRFGGGSESMSLALCQHAVRHGHEAWLVHAQQGDMVGAYRDVGVECHQLPVVPIAVRRPVEAFRSIRSLVALTRRVGADILFTSQVNYVSLLAAVRHTGARAAVHLGLTYDYPSPIFRAGVRRIDLGVAPSVHTAQGWLERGWPEASLRVIPNGIDTHRFSVGAGRDAARSRCGLPDAGALVAYVGRLVPEKGIVTLLRAFAQHYRTDPTSHLLFVGNAPTGEHHLLDIAAHEVGLPRSAWEVRPATPTPEDVYRAADLVVVPSEWDEPFGLVPIEAASCGTLSIVSDRGLLPTLVASLDSAAVFRSGDVSNLAERLAYWLGDAACRHIAAKRLSEDVRTRFGFEDCGNAYLTAFESIRSR